MKGVPKVVGSFKPRTILCQTEHFGIRVRKILMQLRSGSGGARRRLLDDVLALATRIEDVSHYGQRSSAVEALECVAVVEVLIAQLQRAVDAYFASTSRRA